MAVAKEPDFLDVTEISGQEISGDQLFRLCNRYYWAATQSAGKRVLEIACGSGPGIGLLQSVAELVIGADVSEPVLATARKYYGERADLRVMDAHAIELDDNSVDVVIIFEALYYLKSAEKFAQECRRILRPGGCVLISNANKDLYDFNPSPYSYVYHGVRELEALFAANGFSVEFWGSSPVQKISLRQKVLRPIKKAAVKFNLMPKTMAGKKLLKRLVFGQMCNMPAEVKPGMVETEELEKLPPGQPCLSHRVIYAKATLRV